MVNNLLIFKRKIVVGKSNRRIVWEFDEDRGITVKLPQTNIFIAHLWDAIIGGRMRKLLKYC